MNADRIQCQGRDGGIKPPEMLHEERASVSITSPRNCPDRLLADGARVFRDKAKLRVTPYGSVVVVAGAPPTEAASGAAMDAL